MASQTKVNFGTVIRVIGFLADIVTLSVLFNSNVTPRVPIINYPIGTTAKLTLWAIAVVTYLGILRSWWLPTTKKIFVQPTNSFAEFVFFDVLLGGFRYWYWLIPFIVLVGFLIGIFAEMGVAFWIIAIIVLAIFLFISSTVDQQNREARELAELEKPDIYDLWVQRIKKELSELGYATSHDLSILHNEPASICRKALNKYFKQHEIQENLILISDSLQVHGDSSTYRALVLARRTLASSKPWVRDPRR